MSTGAASAAITYIRTELAQVFEAAGWELLTADSKFAAWNILFTAGNSGVGIIGWNGDSKVSQAGASLVINLKLSITISGRRHLQDPALGKLARTDADRGRLMEVHDRVKGAMLGLSMPSEIIAEAIGAIPVYSVSVPVFSPEGIPLDAIEQTWECTLKETFSPEHLET